MTFIPLAEGSFGMGATNFTGTKKNNGGGGMGATMKATAMLQIFPDGTSRIISLKNVDAVSKIIDLAPEIVNKFRGTPSRDEAFASQDAVNEAAEKVKNENKEENE